MSNFQIIARAPYYEVTVGFDNPLQSFFAIVRDLRLRVDDEEMVDDVVLHVGADLSEPVTSVSDLAAHVSPYAEIPTDVSEAIEKERQSSLGPTDLQREMIGFLRQAHAEIERGGDDR